MLKSNHCDNNDAYILVRGGITIIGHNLQTEVAFKNCAPFIKYMAKTDGTTIDDAEDLVRCDVIIYELQVTNL